MTKTVRSNLSDSLKSHAPIAGTIGTIGGFAADVLAPLADFALYIFLAGLIISFFLGVKWFKKSKPELIEAISDKKLTDNEIRELFVSNKVSKAFSFSAILTVIMLFVTVGQWILGDEDKGLLATNIPGIEQLQGQLLNIEKGINEIKETTEGIKQDTVDIKQDTTKILDGVNAVASKIEDFSDDIEEIKGLAGLIGDPKTFPEFAHNAKVHIEQENYEEAHIIYEKLATLGHNFFDIFSDHEFVCRKMGMSFSKVEKYFNEYPSKNGMKFMELRLAVELTDENYQRFKPDMQKDGDDYMQFIIKEFDLIDVLKPIRKYCEKYPTDSIGRLYYIFFARQTIKCSTALYDGWTFSETLEGEFMPDTTSIYAGAVSVWQNLLNLCNDALNVEQDMRLQYSDAKNLKRRFFWKDYDFGGNQQRESEVVPMVNDTSGFAEMVQQSYGNSDLFQNWSLFYTIFGNGESWGSNSFGPDPQRFDGGISRLKWSDVPRFKRFQSEYIEHLSNGKLDVVSVIPDFIYNKMIKWYHYLGGKTNPLPPYSEWAFMPGHEKIEIIEGLLSFKIEKTKNNELSNASLHESLSKKYGIDLKIFDNLVVAGGRDTNQKKNESGEWIKYKTDGLGNIKLPYTGWERDSDRGELKNGFRILVQYIDGKTVRLMQFKDNAELEYEKRYHTDLNGEIILTIKDGKKSLYVGDLNGETLFNDSIDTEAERQGLPANIIPRLEQLESQ
jgi:hypothetical protein